MDSLKAFLTRPMFVSAESDFQPGDLTVLLQNDQPARVFDRTGEPQPFEVILVADPELLTENDVATLVIVAEQTKWIVIVNHSNQVCGVIEPQSVENMQIAAKAAIRQGEFGSAITSPMPHKATKKTDQPNLGVADYRLLREWWHQVLREYGRYQCYAFFLCLPSDEEAVKYVANFSKELDLLSHENCLVITLSKTGFRRSGYDETVWNLAVNEHISEGYSMTVAQHFKIKYIDFPCIVFFEDVRSPKRVVFSFKDLKMEEIAKQMRTIFTVVQQAVINRKKPVSFLERHRSTEQFNKVRQNALGKLFSFAGTTFETAMEAWINASLKQ
jgi:hypothetical protein